MYGPEGKISKKASLDPDALLAGWLPKFGDSATQE